MSSRSDETLSSTKMWIRFCDDALREIGVLGIAEIGVLDGSDDREQVGLSCSTI